ncbi:MAG TPA: adenylyl-sulfate reductase [Casimicrobiaceae bacterium]|nr:adenylyl-sulfate reductase [Casimicrobiaceae bacterium]
MFTTNPFAALTDVVPPIVIQTYIVLMAVAVIAGTVIDMVHKGSATFFAQRRQRAQAAALRRLSGGETVSLAFATVAEAAVSGEFCKWPRRISHLLMMYGFIVYLITTIAMIFAYRTTAAPPVVLPTLWIIGALMILIGGLWFFFFLRVNVAYDGASPFHLGQADLFVGSLLVSVAFALIWHYLQTTAGYTVATWIAFGIFVFFTTLLFVSVPWSKFAHMFFKPVVAFQRRVEEASGCSDLPSASTENYIVRS